MKVKIKNLQGAQHEIEAEASLTVDQFKDLISAQMNVPKENQVVSLLLPPTHSLSQRLIFMGRVLRDNQTLASYGRWFVRDIPKSVGDVKEGSTLHLVSNSRSPQQQQQQQQQQDAQQPQSQAQPQQAPQPFPNLFGAFGITTGGSGGGGDTSSTTPQANGQPQVMRIRLNPQDFFRMMQTGQFPAFGPQGQAQQQQPPQQQTAQSNQTSTPVTPSVPQAQGSHSQAVQSNE